MFNRFIFSCWSLGEEDVEVASLNSGFLSCLLNWASEDFDPNSHPPPDQLGHPQDLPCLQVISNPLGTSQLSTQNASAQDEYLLNIPSISQQTASKQPTQQNFTKAIPQQTVSLQHNKTISYQKTIFQEPMDVPSPLINLQSIKPNKTVKKVVLSKYIHKGDPSQIQGFKEHPAFQMGKRDKRRSLKIDNTQHPAFQMGKLDKRRSLKINYTDHTVTSRGKWVVADHNPERDCKSSKKYTEHPAFQMRKMKRRSLKINDLEDPVTSPGQWVVSDHSPEKNHKSFGAFECPNCSQNGEWKMWISAHAWSAFHQKCKKCKAGHYPKFMWQNTGKTEFYVQKVENDKPHLSELCEVCQTQGTDYCTRGNYKHRF